MNKVQSNTIKGINFLLQSMDWANWFVNVQIFSFSLITVESPTDMR